MTDESREERICLSREIEGTRIEVWLNSAADFSEGFRRLFQLCQQAKVETAKIDLSNYWTERDGVLVLTSRIQDGPSRVALSLFMSWPECKRPIEIQSETGLSSGSVSNILVGRQGNLDTWFDRCSEGWMLSKTGVSNVIDELIPLLQNRQDG